MAYTTTILESSKELTKAERVMMKDTSLAYKIDEVTQNGDIDITVTGYVLLNVHNDKSNPQDYQNLIVLTENGERYVTGSQSFMVTFMNIFSEMQEEDGTVYPFTIKIFRRPSKNYSGKEFLTCSLIA